MNRGRVIVEGLGDFKTFDGFVILLAFGVENTEPVIGGGVFLVKFQNSKQGFFGAKRFTFVHRGLRNLPKFFHLSFILGRFFGFRIFLRLKRKEKD